MNKDIEEDIKMLKELNVGVLYFAKDEETKKYIQAIENVLEDRERLIEENEGLKRQIDLMAEEITNYIGNTCPLADYNVDLDCKNKCNNDYKECWKLYFDKKVQERICKLK